jgi:AraC-like DNA-binding protein
MKILSGVIGNLILPSNLLPQHIANHVNYGLEGKTGKYFLCKVYNPKIFSWFIEIECQKNDNLTLISPSPLVCLQIALMNTCKIKIAGNHGDTVLHEHSFSIFNPPALHAQWEIKKDNAYSLCSIFYPLQSLNGILHKDSRSLIELKEGKTALSKIPHVADTHILKLVQELRNAQDDNSIYENCKEIITRGTQIIEANLHRTHNAVKEKDANQIYKVKKFVDEHIEQKLTLSIIVDKTKVSKHIIKTYFKILYGDTLHNYIILKKLETTLPQLLANDKIADIARAIDLDATTFTRLFKKYYSLSPSEYRERNMQKG